MENIIESGLVMNHMLAAQADVRIPYIISIYIKLTFVHFKVSKQSKEYIILNTLTHAHTHTCAHMRFYIGFVLRVPISNMTVLIALINQFFLIESTKNKTCKYSIYFEERNPVLLHKH